jgi:flavin-dependent dehydrogenase
MNSDAANCAEEGLASYFNSERPLPCSLVDGSRVAVIGGGPAGSLFSYFLCRFADLIDLDLAVDIFEPRFFTHSGPAGCNHCGGVVSESLVQLLAAEGINLPPGVIQRGIESYMLHMDVGDVRIESPRKEKRIASVFRGNGPRESRRLDAPGFDGYLLELASSVGANVMHKLVNGIVPDGDRFAVHTLGGCAGTYDLVAIAVGVNSRLLDALPAAAPPYRRPELERMFICEFDLGEEAVRQHFGDSMHVFLLDIPRLEFAALIPKGPFVALCLVGKDVDEGLVETFLASPEVIGCFPGRVLPPLVCHCFPRANTAAALRPYADRLVWIGDCGVARLYKDGIGSAYRTSKAAARTAVFHGISERDFEAHFWPECRALIVDNAIAKVIFGITTLIQRIRFLRRGVLRMTAVEQASSAADKAMSSVLWDVFTGSAPYREILLRTLQPTFSARLLWNLVAGNVNHRVAGVPRIDT